MTTPKWQPGHTYLPGDLVQPLQVVTPAPTTLTNPDFETGLITGWTVTQSGGTGTASVSSGKKFSGTYAGRWQGAAGTGHAGGVEADWVNDTEVAVKPGQSASATLYLALDDTDSSQNQARARLYWYDASHALLSHTDGTLVHGDDSSWHLSTVSGTAPAAAAFARMGAWTTANNSGGVRLDNATWSIIAAAAAAGLIYKAVQAGAGVSANTEPAWPNTNGLTVVDNTVTWEAVTASRVVWEAAPICKSGGTEPDWPTIPGAFVNDGTVSWECISRRVEDPKCPNTKVVAILSSKVFAADGDIIRFSATANPLDWSSADDAGYLPSGLQQANANDMAVLAPYRSNLTALNASSFQNWQVDPDPAAMALLDQMDGIGSTWQHAAQPVANDLFFLSQLGVRSVGISAGADNLAAGDIGMPVDVLIQAQLAIAGVWPLSTYYPGAGQYWLAFGTEQLPYSPSIAGDLPGGTVGDSGTYQYVLSGGVAPLTASISSGSLPPGATMDSHGLVTYAYTTGGSYTWSVRVTDAVGTHVDLPDAAAVADDLSSAILADAPILYWKLNETSGTVAADSSGHGRDGTITGTPTLSSSGLTLVNTSDGVLGPVDNALCVAQDTGWAHEAIVTRYGARGSAAEIIMAEWVSSNFGYHSGSLRFAGTGDVDAGKPVASFTTAVSHTEAKVTGSSVAALATRTHWMGVRTPGTGGAMNFTLYKNGVQVAQDTTSAETLLADATTTLAFVVGAPGASYYPASYALNAKVEHVAVYDQPITAARALYHAQKAGLA